MRLGFLGYAPVHLYLYNNHRADSVLTHVSALHTVNWIGLGASTVTDDGIELLTKLRKLERLNLDATGVSDVGVEHLKSLDRLKALSLMGCHNVTDAAVPHLSHLKNLETLILCGTSISEDGTAALKKQLPSCGIITGNVTRLPTPDEFKEDPFFPPNFIDEKGVDVIDGMLRHLSRQPNEREPQMPTPLARSPSS